MSVSTLVDPRRVAADAASIGAQRGGEPREGNGARRKKSACLAQRSHSARASPTIPGSTPKSRDGAGGSPRPFTETRRFAAAAAAVAANASARARLSTGLASAQSRGIAVGGGARSRGSVTADHRASRSRRRLASFSASSLFSSKMTAKAFM